MLFLVERQQGLAAQVGIANGARKIAELGVSDENVAFVTGLCLKRLGAVGTVNVTQLKGKCGMRKLCLLLLVSIFMTYMEGVVTSLQQKHMSFFSITTASFSIFSRFLSMSALRK